jgi:hypothetical protein
MSKSTSWGGKINATANAAEPKSRSGISAVSLPDRALYLKDPRQGKLVRGQGEFGLGGAEYRGKERRSAWPTANQVWNWKGKKRPSWATPSRRARKGIPPAAASRGIPRDLPVRGIYLFSEGGKDLYIGRTNRMRHRLRGHCVTSANHFSATFAFRIARKETGKTKASYAQSGSRPELLKDAAFA